MDEYINDDLKHVWVDLTTKLARAVRKEDHEMRDRIVDVIFNLEKVYPGMQTWYLHTFTKD